MATIMNPGVPVCLAVDGGISVGSMIFIQGVAPYPPSRFSINLQAGVSVSEPRPTTSVHFNPRFDNQNVVRNHFDKGSWGCEEINGGFPFQNGQQFEVILNVEHSGFKFAVNGKHYCDFRHRVKKEMCSYLRIDGQVKINYIRFQGGFMQPPVVIPPSMPSYPAVSQGYGLAYPPTSQGYASPPAVTPMYNPPVPFKMSLPGGMYPGRMINVSGVVHSSPERFSINLSCGAYPNADIAFHFNPRFSYGSDNYTVVRNHFQAGAWGPEERHQTRFPFMPGAAFDLIILIEPNCIKVAVNNQHFTEFNHRIHPLSRIDTLDIDGHLRLTCIRVQ